MNIIYIRRNEIPSSQPVKRFLKVLKNYFYCYDQDGFFEDSLQAIEATKHAVSFKYLRNRVVPLDKDTEAVIVNLKCCNFNDAQEQKQFFRDFLRGKDHIVKCLFINAAQVSYMFDDEILDNFDVIFKREPYKNKDLYAISAKNKAKIKSTMIHCPFVYAPRTNFFAQLYKNFVPKTNPCRPRGEKYDVGFSGVDASTHTIRRDAWQAVVDAGFKTVGGLQPNPHNSEVLPIKLQGPRQKGRSYRAALCNAKINLALNGIGEYTFRHQELLYLGKFILSSPAIQALELPIPLEEGKHYVAYTDVDDMIEKIYYYISHDEERQRIAKAGHDLFMEHYNPVRHGAYISNAILEARKTKESLM